MPATATTNRDARQVDITHLGTPPVTRVSEWDGGHVAPGSKLERDVRSGQPASGPRARIVLADSMRGDFAALLAAPVETDVRDAYGRTPEEQRAAALAVLRKAHDLVRRGWVQRASGGEDAEGRWRVSLYGAVAEASGGDIRGEYARRVLRRLAGTSDLVAWNDHPFRTQREVLSLLERAVAECGGMAPRRGGWRVAS